MEWNYGTERTFEVCRLSSNDAFMIGYHFLVISHLKHYILIGTNGKILRDMSCLLPSFYDALRLAGTPR